MYLLAAELVGGAPVFVILIRKRSRTPGFRTANVSGVPWDGTGCSRGPREPLSEFTLPIGTNLRLHNMY